MEVVSRDMGIFGALISKRVVEFASMPKDRQSASFGIVPVDHIRILWIAN